MTTHDSSSENPSKPDHNATESNKEIKYEIGDVIAQGGMGIILEAKDKELGRTVAMKMVLANTPNIFHENEQLTQEAQTLSGLEHPNIVPLYEFSHTKENEPYYTMRKIKGATLTDLIKSLRKQDSETVKNYPLSQLLSIFQKICDAIAFSHSKHTLHRDLKPDNIMIGEFGELFVMDWGLSKSLPSQIDLSTTNISSSPKNWTLQGWGTKGYIAPEQANKQQEKIDQRTDIFSLGAILYTLLALRPPLKTKYGKGAFHEIIPPSLLHKIFRANIKKHFPHCPNNKIPESLSAVAIKALSYTPEQRYQTVQELQSEITAYQSGFETQAEKAKWTRKLTLFIGRYRSQFLIGSAALIIITFLSANFLIRLIASEKEATQALNDLRATAPIFYSEANTFLKKNQVDEALKQIKNAIQLNPKNSEYHNFEGNLLQISLDFPQAIASYDKALKINPKLALAEKNKAICQDWKNQVSNNPSYIDSKKIGNFAKEMLNQKRPYDALALITLYIKNNLKTSSLTQKDPVSNKSWKDYILENLTINAVGGLQLNLIDVSFSDLNPIAWVPLNYLLIWFSPIDDLSPLTDMPLEELEVNVYQSIDLTPLKKLPLKRLLLNSPRLTDLSPLQNLSFLKELSITASSVTNIDSLEGLPLKELKLQGLKIHDIQAAKRMPLTKFAIATTKVYDLSPLKGKLLSSLIVSRSPLEDLGPLQSMPLIDLSLRATPIKSIQTLANMPLIRLDLSQCQYLKDISPLLTCTNLEELILPPKAKNIESLRKMPKLKAISYESIGSVYRWSSKQNAKTFWENYDDLQQEKEAVSTQEFDSTYNNLIQVNSPSKTVTKKQEKKASKTETDRRCLELRKKEFSKQ